MMPDLPRLFYPCRYAYRGARETPHRRHEAALKSISDTNRRNGLASTDTIKCGETERSWSGTPGDREGTFARGLRESGRDSFDNQMTSGLHPE
jgi:hypothetical protein